MTFSAETTQVQTRNGIKYSTAIKVGRKATAYKYFRNEEFAQSHVKREKRIYERKLEEDQQKAELLAEAKSNFVNSYKVGDILYDSWGYEQTNLEWYQVVGTTKLGVKVRRIAHNYEATGKMQGKETPVKGEFTSEKVETFRITVCADGSHFMKKASLWNGEALHSSSYA